MLLVSGVPTSAQGSAVIRLSSLTVPLDSQGMLEVYIDCGTTICTAFNLELAYDPHIIRVDALTEGNYFGEDLLIVESQIDPEAGTLKWTAVALRDTPADPDAALFIINFTAEAVGQTQFIGSNLEVGDLHSLFATLRGGVINVVTNAPPTLTRTPALRTTRTATPAPLNVNVSRPNSLRSGLAFPSIWEGIAFDDISSPGMVEYRREIDPQQTYRWVFTWCATEPITIDSIYPNVAVSFLVNGHEQPDILAYELPDCHGWMALLSDWTANSTVNLDVAFSISADTYDGTKTYLPGNYVHRIIVTVP